VKVDQHIIGLRTDLSAESRRLEKLDQGFVRMKGSKVKARGFKDKALQYNYDFGLTFESLYQLATVHRRQWNTDNIIRAEMVSPRDLDIMRSTQDVF